MRPKYLILIITVCLITFLVVLRAFAIDLGGGGLELPAGSGAVAVKIEEQPVQVVDSKAGVIQTVIDAVQLDYGEESESSFLDVRDYQSVAFYVIPEKILTEPQVAVRYQLDAFFSVETEIMTMMKFGGERDVIESGSQEFGHMRIKEEGGDGEPSFIKLTTGETGSRILYTPVIGPFVRVVFKSLTESDRRRFRVKAYLIP